MCREHRTPSKLLAIDVLLASGVAMTHFGALASDEVKKQITSVGPIDRTTKITAKNTNDPDQTCLAQPLHSLRMTFWLLFIPASAPGNDAE